MHVNIDCRFFKGEIPCIFHKKENLHCADCKHYERISERILVIKLGAVGDVIRTTPLLRKLKQVYPDAEINWLTEFPDIVPQLVDNIYGYEMKNIVYLLANRFDIIYNLDKDKDACALAQLIPADQKKGFVLNMGRCAPVDADAENKWLTGIFDDVSRQNSKSYVEEIFEIAGFKFSGEKYILDRPKLKPDLPTIASPVIGLNTGCGKRWLPRLWPEDKWTKLAIRLKENGFSVLLLGGPDEDDKNRRIARKSNAEYWGVVPLNEFIEVVNQTDLVVTAVTMALHVAIALEKKIILLNNIFNRHEFYLYGLGEIIEPPVDCLGCYKTECDKNCMETITVEEVFSKICQIIDKNSTK
ncbi:TPA: glycosyltransferase family 9 protein [Candidatus Poribacteria bacterium]|nr:glycosyltransferase family 9 protein [Candidatus Poribacteria bacterium]